MVSQYVHILLVTTLNNDAVQDSDGNWQQTGEAVTQSLPCRAEPNGNSFITLPDGSKYSYAFVVYMPAGSPDIPGGTPVTISEIASGTVKQFYRGQLNCRLWL
jgi:hypothetical protein